MTYRLDMWSAIATIVALPLAVVGWFMSGKSKTNKSVAKQGGTAASGDIHSDGRGVTIGHGSTVSLSVHNNGHDGGRDAYEKRYAVLQGMRAYLNELACNLTVSDGTLATMRRHSDDASLLFDDPLASYVREFFDHAAKCHSVTLAALHFAEGSDKARAARKAGEHRDWLLAQSDSLTARFRPVLRLTS